MAIRRGFHDEGYAIVDLVSSKALEDTRVVHSRYCVNVWTLYYCMFLLLELFTAHLMACLDYCDQKGVGHSRPLIDIRYEQWMIVVEARPYNDRAYQATED